MAQNPKELLSIFNYFSLFLCVLIPLVPVHQCVSGLLQYEFFACGHTSFTYAVTYGLFFFNLILVVNIFTKHDMHRVLKLVILIITTILNIILGFEILLGVLIRERYDDEDTKELWAAILCFVHAIVYVVITGFVNSKTSRRAGRVVNVNN